MLGAGKGSPMAKARSNYKQVRVTLTEGPMRSKPGRVRIDVRVMVKPLEAEWNQRHTMLICSADDLAPLASMDEVYAAILETLAAPPLPGHIG